MKLLYPCVEGLAGYPMNDAPTSVLSGSPPMVSESLGWRVVLPVLQSPTIALAALHSSATRITVVAQSTAVADSTSAGLRPAGLLAHIGVLLVVESTVPLATDEEQDPALARVVVRVTNTAPAGEAAPASRSAT